MAGILNINLIEKKIIYGSYQNVYCSRFTELRYFFIAKI